MSFRLPKICYATAAVQADSASCDSLRMTGFVRMRNIMQSKFYRPDEQRAEKVHELFATIARRYDLLNDIMSAGLHRRWKQRLVELGGVGVGPVAAGTPLPQSQSLGSCAAARAISR